jgi:nucleoside-diphosphate-sugar epimerase
MKIFVAGATGAIGSRLLPLLLACGHAAWGMTRASAKAAELDARGVKPVWVDAFDPIGLTDALLESRPHVVIHQLTDLPPGLDPARMATAIEGNARIRREGTANLVAAATAAGAHRLIAQSIAWIYAPGATPHTEDDPLDVEASGSQALTIGGVVALEQAVLEPRTPEGIVLRYGHIYGPRTGSDTIGNRTLPLHVDAAAWAACLAVDRGSPGIYNIVAANDRVSAAKARRELRWDEGLRVPD